MDQYTMALKKYTEEYEDWCLCNKIKFFLTEWSWKIIDITITKVAYTESKNRDTVLGGERQNMLVISKIKNN